MVDSSFMETGPLITSRNSWDRSFGGPYNCNVHVSITDGVSEHSMELIYKGRPVKRMFGSHDELCILLMAAINEHQLDLARRYDFVEKR